MSKPTKAQSEQQEIKLPEVAPEGNLPATVESADTGATQALLTYANASDEEKAVIDSKIASIDLLNSDTIIALGGETREKLANLADELLDTFKPEVKLAFAEALAALIDTVKQNSLDNMKKRSTSRAFKKLWKAIVCTLTGKDYRVELNKEMIGNFMTNVSDSRETIAEVVDTLVEQQTELSKNFNRINTIGKATVLAAKEMQIERAATEEYIRRVDAGEITTLIDLEEKAKSGRPEDVDNLRSAQASWNHIRVVDGDLLGALASYDMNSATMAFTRDANAQNRIQTASALTTTITDWKWKLVSFATVLVERTAGQTLDTVRELSEKASKENKDLFEALAEETVARSAKGNYNLLQLMDDQKAYASTLENVGTRVEEEFNQLAQAKADLAKTTAEFREKATNIYGGKGTLISTQTPGTPSVQ
jgi:uncharacterized protein YaaN involved in tellurite resistance